MTGQITWAELNSQPQAWAALIARLQSGAVALPVDPSGYDQILLLGSGTSYYLARAVADWMCRRGWNAQAVASCEVMLDPFPSRPMAARRLAIGFSRSGRSSELRHSKGGGV
jgi:glutamine---fructose-6-phosphate transaminase (isomerizing)